MERRPEIDGLRGRLIPVALFVSSVFSWRDGDHGSAAGPARFVGRMTDGFESPVAETLGG